MLQEIMSYLFKNAVTSMQLGIEDFKYADSTNGRYLSAIRNYYSGLLLLAKEVLVRQTPNANPDEVISDRYKPIPDGTGGVKFVQSSQHTIDFNTIGERFKDFNLSIDQSTLRELNKIRNEVEHLYTKRSDEAIRETIAKTFPLAIKLFRLIKEDPKRALGDSWDYVLEEKEAYDQALKQCKDSLTSIDWISEIISSNYLYCPVCESNLVYQKDESNKIQDNIHPACMSCGEDLFNSSYVIAYSLDKILEIDSYIRAKEGDFSSLLLTCPNCGIDSYIGSENQCACCGYKIDSDKRECMRCGEGIPIEDIIEGDYDNGICSYCTYKMEKD